MMPDSNDGYAQRHNEDPPYGPGVCTGNWAAMIYDPDCARCSKINKVIQLRRKTIKNGCSQQESVAAQVMATRIIEQYKLTRGEVFDREYDEPVIVQKQAAQRTYHDQYGAAATRHRYSARPRGGRKMSEYEKNYNADEMSFE